MDFRQAESRYRVLQAQRAAGEMDDETYRFEVAKLLKDKALTVSPIKLEGYLNIDSGTLNPFRHGEVFERSQTAGEHGKQGFACAIRSRTRLVSCRCDKGAASPLAGDDPHQRRPALLLAASDFTKLSRSDLRISTAAPRGKSPIANGP